MVVDVASKRLQLLKEAMPGLRRLGVLWDPTVPWHSKAAEALAAPAKSMGVDLMLVPAQQAAELDAAFSMLQRGHVQALYVFESSLFVTRPEAILGFAAKMKIPVMAPWRSWRCSCWPTKLRGERLSPLVARAQGSLTGQ